MCNPCPAASSSPWQRSSGRSTWHDRGKRCLGAWHEPSPCTAGCTGLALEARIVAGASGFGSDWTHEPVCLMSHGPMGPVPRWPRGPLPHRLTGPRAHWPAYVDLLQGNSVNKWMAWLVSRYTSSTHSETTDRPYPFTGNTSWRAQWLVMVTNDAVSISSGDDQVTTRRYMTCPRSHTKWSGPFTS